MTNFLQALLGVILVSLIPLVGLLSLALSKQNIAKYTNLLVSFAIGALLGNAFLHLIPEAFENTRSPLSSGLLIILGIILFYALEQFLNWHHGHDTEVATNKRPVALMSILGDSAHNFLDGLLIAGSFMTSSTLGWVTLLAIVLHEIPQEIADFGVLLHAQWPMKRIILVNLLSGFLAIAGLVLGYLTGSALEDFALSTLSVTAGGFIYIACTDLIPDLHQHGAINGKHRVAQLGIIALGILLFVVL